MDTDSLEPILKSYETIAKVCGRYPTPRAKPWAAAGDHLLLNKVLPDIDSDDNILDFGCGGCPWITHYLDGMSYEVVGIDRPKEPWHTYNLTAGNNLQLVEYDAQNLPFNDDSFELVLVFGVLEHVGVWDGDVKFREPNEKITNHRRNVLREIRRITSPDGRLLLTKFPNLYGRDKFPNGRGHLDSERTRPARLKKLVSEHFVIESLFANGLLPHRLPFGTPLQSLPALYAQIDDFLSNLPLLHHIAQNYGLIARPRID